MMELRTRSRARTASGQDEKQSPDQHSPIEATGMDAGHDRQLVFGAGASTCEDQTAAANDADDKPPAKKVRKNGEPYVPEGGEYQPIEMTDRAAHKQRVAHMARLGVDESMLVPTAHPRPIWAGGGRGLWELQGKWRPTRMRFNIQWPSHELDNNFFEHLTTDLWVRIYDFAKRYFGRNNLAASPSWTSPWISAGFSEQFCYYTSLVARQDPKTGGWDALVEQQAFRVPLVQAIIAQVLMESVLRELLFGADQLQQRYLDAQDEATIQVEGYSRTFLRRNSIRAATGPNTITPNFWARVDELTVQLTTLFAPLLRLMDAHFPESLQVSLRHLHQDLHHIVAEAGYLNIATRQSMTIFRFTMPVLGLGWEQSQQQISADTYNDSKKASNRQERVLEAEWERRRAAAGEAYPKDTWCNPDAARGSTVLTRLVRTWFPSLLSTRHHLDAFSFSFDRNHVAQQAASFYIPRSRVAAVQLAVFPLVERFATTGDFVEHTAAHDYRGKGPVEGVGDGRTVTTICKAIVTYYVSFVDPTRNAAEETPELRDYIRHKRWQSWTSLGSWLTPARLALFLAVLLLLLWAGQRCRQEWEWDVGKAWDQVAKLVHG